MKNRLSDPVPTPAETAVFTLSIRLLRKLAKNCSVYGHLSSYFLGVGLARQIPANACAIADFSELTSCRRTAWKLLPAQVQRPHRGRRRFFRRLCCWRCQRAQSAQDYPLEFSGKLGSSRNQPARLQRFFLHAAGCRKGRGFPYHQSGMENVLLVFR
jgi:hypothetical protein